MTTVTKCVPEHLQQIAQKVGDDYLNEVLGVLNFESPKHSLSIVKDGIVLASGGLTPISPRMAEFWMVVPDKALVRDDLKVFVKICRTMSEKLAEAGGFKRIQASASVKSPEDARFLIAMGFEREGLMRSYGMDGSDHELFSRIYA